jgi:Stress responsive A/B Barrel Domain
MVIHIALFAWKDSTSSQVILDALEAVRRMQDKVAGLKSIYCGENFSRWNEGFTHAVVVLAESREALEAYRKHPDHVAVGKLIDSMETKSLGVDFEDQ